MDRRIVSRVRTITPSATLTIDTKTKALIKEGKPVINMSVGEPDFDTPMAASFAGMQAIAKGNTRYTPASGTLELRKAIARKLKLENGLDYTPEQIVVSGGAKHSLFNVFLTICETGDEVILPAPYWVTYPEQIRLAGADPIIIPCSEDTGFKLTPAQLKAAITSRTRAIVLNSPSNPTGAVYSEQELRALGEILRQHDIFVVTDEIYERLVYGVTHVSYATLFPESRDNIILVNGFSKAFAMTGWRLGYVAAASDIAKAMSSLQSHATGSPATMAQAAGVVALDSFEPAMVQEFERRRNLLVEGLQSIPGVTCLKPEGAFYAFPNVSGLFGRSWRGRPIQDAGQFCEVLLEEKLVSVVPGDAFGAPNNIRISYAVSYEEVQGALHRLREFVQELS